MGRRTLLLIAALVVAALGTALVYLYVLSLGTQQEPVEVLVATERISVGTSVADAAGLLELREVSSSVPLEGELTTVAGREDDILLTTMFPGDPLTSVKLGEDASITGYTEEGSTLVPVQLDAVARLAGFVVPGSEVDLLLTTSEGTTTRLLSQARVATVGGQAAIDSNGAGAVTGAPEDMVGLALTAEDALTVTLARGQGTLQLVLPGSDAASGQQGATATIEDLGAR